ncbi:CMP-N-acetylneuraminate-beta-galactosamide-alpha-2,3-sialyltransferase 1-like [Protopterus annectens]|uniref:CMP-N-acetylneuraminate-beta-galactosamide- alpha-2,3-sialyltransferase 1-like n=1 Tax=Protopterus annectens TaxID=7888 RepID=UPI001CF97460|nr:CMP-N-acetylneuraminate-beta-galactosamide-alpha-2,3-sialyltransferase 1-like [Protopterus annectens]
MVYLMCKVLKITELNLEPVKKHITMLNHAPTVGFESDVGSKTTHQFMYPESAKDLPENVSLVLVPFKTLDLKWIVSALTTGDINFTYIKVPRKVSINKDKILIYSPTFMKYVYDTWVEKHGRYPSTGILAVVFALHLCDELDVYGFGADSNGNWHHYWENNYGAAAFRKTGVHDADFEANVTATLLSIGKLHLFRGK